ncbi:MAG: hypothetical protein GX649_19830 [Chloroflexi bacterium]|nr:hypothetical protein [Chloroflexota bacterium]
MTKERWHWLQVVVFALTGLYLVLKVWADYTPGDLLTLVAVVALYKHKRWGMWLLVIGRLLHTLYQAAVGGPQAFLAALVWDVLSLSLLTIVVLRGPHTVGGSQEA